MGNYNYKRSGLKVEIIIRDDNFRKLDTFKFNINEFGKFLKLIKKKYGITIKEYKDLDWV